jgi:serine/threonine protein kinase
MEAAETRTATGAGVLLGTAGYMSPEQARGRPADARSDLFSLGAVLYEMVSGRRAFDGATPADSISAILDRDPPAIPADSEPVPVGLERIVRRCLEKEPDDRFQTARDLAFALESLLGPALWGAPRATTYPRREWVLADAAALVLAAMATGAFLWASRPRVSGTAPSPGP